MFRKRPAPALLASLIALLLIACGQSGDPISTGGGAHNACRTDGPRHAAATAAHRRADRGRAHRRNRRADWSRALSPEQATTTPVAAAQSLLQRQDTPPPEVSAYLPMEYGGLAFTCQALPDDSLGLQITIYEAEHEVAQGFSFCFSGYAPNQPIQVEVTLPDGTVRQQEVPALYFGPEAMDWVTRPGDPLGQYSISATQGDQRASGSFVLKPATQPRMVVFQETGVQITIGSSPGSTVQIVLAGFDPAAAGAVAPLQDAARSRIARAICPTAGSTAHRCRPSRPTRPGRRPQPCAPPWTTMVSSGW